MLSHLLFLAQQDAPATSNAADASSGGFSLGNIFDQLVILSRPDELLDNLARIPLILAAVIVVVGILCVFNGYRWHKWVVAILAFLCGLGLGYILSERMGKPIIVATSVGALCAIIATPLLRITVLVFGGLTGAFIGANTWTVFQDPAATDTHWAGAIIGFVVLAMASLMLFRLVVVLFTSVGGAVMAICGGICLLMQVPDWEPAIREGLSSNHLLIPLLLLLAAVSGFVIQESRLRSDGVSIIASERKEE